MASQASSQLLRRLAINSPASQRCACSMSAGPSVVKRAQNEIRSMHSSARATQERQGSQRDLMREHEESSMTSSKRQMHTATMSRASDSSTRLSQTRQASDLATLKQEVFDIETDSSSVPATEDAKPTSKLPSYSFARPKQHPTTEGRLVCTLHLNAYADDLENLDFFTKFCVHAAYAFGLPCSLPSFLPTKSSLRTVPRSPFVHKPSQENFVKKEHKRLLKIHDADLNAVYQWIDYISENSMSGVRIKATTWEKKPLRYGQKMISDTQELEPSEGQKVKELAESLLAAGFGEESVDAEKTSESGSALKTEPSSVSTQKDSSKPQKTE